MRSETLKVPSVYNDPDAFRGFFESYRTSKTHAQRGLLDLQNDRMLVDGRVLVKLENCRPYIVQMDRAWIVYLIVIIIIEIFDDSTRTTPVKRRFVSSAVFSWAINRKQAAVNLGGLPMKATAQVLSS